MGTELNEIKKGLQTIKKAIESQTPDPKDKISEKLSKYDKEISERIAKIEIKIKEAEDNYKVAAKFFCENPSDASDKFGEKIYKFWNVLLKCKKEIDKIIEAEKKAAKAMT